MYDIADYIREATIERGRIPEHISFERLEDVLGFCHTNQGDDTLTQSNIFLGFFSYCCI
jgi:hypothetical protein